MWVNVTPKSILNDLFGGGGSSRFTFCLNVEIYPRHVRLNGILNLVCNLQNVTLTNLRFKISCDPSEGEVASFGQTGALGVPRVALILAIKILYPIFFIFKLPFESKTQSSWLLHHIYFITK
jgi:hypothetical protein